VNNHREVLNRVAAEHDLPPLTGGELASDYVGYALDLLCIKQGVVNADDIRERRNEIYSRILEANRPDEPARWMPKWFRRAP
jgi:hypothetical protein